MKNISVMIIILLLVGTLMASDTHLSKAEPREVGVRLGDWAKYDVVVNYTTDDPNPPIRVATEYAEIAFEVQVQHVSSTNITFHITVYFKNGTYTTNVGWIDVAGFYPMNPVYYWGFFIAANLTTGDRTYPDPRSLVINATLMRTYAGVEREVNYFGIMQNITGAPPGYLLAGNAYVYWDRMTGIIDEGMESWKYTHLSKGYVTSTCIHFLMKETNIWSPTYIPAEVNVTPESLNFRSRGRWITCYIELPENYNPTDINVSSILLDSTIQAEPKPVAIGNYDSDGIPDLMVKFSRAEVITYILDNIDIEERFTTVILTLTGCLNDGTPFQGSDTIKTIYNDKYERLAAHMLRHEKYMQRFYI